MALADSGCGVGSGRNTDTGLFSPSAGRPCVGSNKWADRQGALISKLTLVSTEKSNKKT